MGSSSKLLAAAARKLEGKVAVITGGASGIGERTARLFCQHGAKVVVADIQDELGKSVCNDIGPAAAFVHCDVTNEEHVSGTVDYAVSKFGKLDIMFNNAGIGGNIISGIENNEKSDFEHVLAVNVVGPFLGTKHAARVMIPSRRGSIIMTASVASVISGCFPHGYATSKHAVAGLAQNTAAELGKYGIRVNCISPGGTATPLTLHASGLTADDFETIHEAAGILRGVRLTTEEIANAALFLASDDSRYISGHNLLVDGGFSVVNPSLAGIFKEQ